MKSQRFIEIHGTVPFELPSDSEILQPEGIDGGTFHRKFLGAEFPEIVPDQIGGFLGLHDPII